MQAIHRWILNIKQRQAYINTLLVVVNVVVFLLMEFAGDRNDVGFILQWGAGYPPLYAEGEYWRMFTLMFLHSDLEHLINNMLLLYLLGDNLERAIGHGRYLLLYVGAGVGASVVSWQVQLMKETAHISLGASGAVFGVLGALLLVLMLNHGKMEGLSLKRFAIMILLSLYSGFTSTGIDNAAHVGGLVIGFVLAFLLNGIRIIRLRKGRENIKYES